jgi:hypothetical protein
LFRIAVRRFWIARDNSHGTLSLTFALADSKMKKQGSL